MKNTLFNSTHELSYRVLLLLNAHGNSKVSVDRLAALDFISVYGMDFSISEENLHGINRFRFSEYAGRRCGINDSIKLLVVLGYVQFHSLKKGFLYSITQEGKGLCQMLNDDYATQYTKNAINAMSFSKEYSDRELAQKINDYSIAVAKEG
jgi:hypothetical protein